MMNDETRSLLPSTSAERTPVASRRWPAALAAAGVCLSGALVYLASTHGGAVEVAQPELVADADGPIDLNVWYYGPNEMSSYPLQFLEKFIAPLIPEDQGSLSFQKVINIDMFLKWDAATVQPGDVMMFTLMTEMFTGTPSGLTDSLPETAACSYNFADDPLLMAPSLMQLLEVKTPMTLIAADDFSCNVNFPKTRHRMYRTSWGDKVMENSLFMPFGIEYSGETFIESLDKGSVPISERPLAFCGVGSLSYRKPSRQRLNDTYTQYHSWIDEIVGGKENYVFDFPDRWENGSVVAGHGYSWSQGVAAKAHGLSSDYLELMAASKLTLCPAGDVWIGGCVYNAIEFGSVPILEAPIEFKGCDHPAHWFNATGAPIFLIEDWSDLPWVLKDALSDPQRLGQMQKDMKTWWDGQKKKFAMDLIYHAKYLRSLSQEDLASEPVCQRVNLTADAQEAIDQRYHEYYANKHWFEEARDSPFYPSGDMCSKHQEKIDPENACFSPACSPPLYEKFECNAP